MRLNIPLTDDDELSAVAEVLESGFLTQGPRTAEFEALIAAQVGIKHAFGVSSATTGLHLALVALGVKAGDEVVIPDFSFPATANAIVQIGATPVFVDIDPVTFNMEPSLLEAAIAPRTKAIMPVHAFGLCADMDSINQVADNHGLPVIEDAACALAGTYRGRQAGALGTVGVFSFHPRKIITTGEGGMITTNDATLARRISVLRTHGGVRGDLYLEFIEAGYNYRLSDIHAAIGVAQMKKLAHITQRRAELAADLSARLSSMTGVTTPTVPVHSTHAFQSYVVMLDDGIDRDAMIRAMKARGIETTLGTYSMHLQPYFAKRFRLADSMFPNATRAHRQALTLPLYPQLEAGDLDQIVQTLGECLAAQT